MTMIAITTVILLFLAVTIIPSSTPMEFNYPEIKPEHTELRLFGNATRLDSGIELTAINRTDQIGHVRHKDLMQLWISGPSFTDVADFTVKFSYTIVAEKFPGGDGIAFFMAEPSYAIPNKTDGKAIGLVSTEELVVSRVGLFAVEFDTLYNPEIDPQEIAGKHVGVNVKSMDSRVSAPWSCSIATNKDDRVQVHDATISYDSRSKNLSIEFSGYNKEKNLVLRRNLYDRISLDDYLPRKVVVGFSAANGMFTSSHVLRSWSFNSTLQSNMTEVKNTPREISSRSNTANKGSIMSGVFLLLLTALGLIIIVVFFKRRNRKEDDDSDSII